MLAESLAICNAIFGALMATSLRKGLMHSNIASALLISTAVFSSGLVIVAIPSFMRIQLTALAIAIFVLDGILSTVFARTAAYKGIERVGASISMSIIGSSPLFSALLAVLVLHERLTPIILYGTISIVAGIVVISWDDKKGGWKKRDLLFPFLSAVLFGSTSILKKVGMMEVGSPIIGSAVNSATAFILFSSFFSLSGKRREISFNRAGVKFFCLSGLFQSFMVFSAFAALNLGKAVTVVPLTNTAPLFTLLISYIFLREVERITIRVALGVILIVAGAALVTF